jgi:hypothetical protein
VMASEDLALEEGVHCLDQLLAEGAHKRSEGNSTAEERARGVRPDDL